MRMAASLMAASIAARLAARKPSRGGEFEPIAALTLNWNLVAIGDDVRTSHIFRPLRKQRGPIALSAAIALPFAATPAFAQSSTSLRIAFRAGYPGAAGAAVGVWGAWQASPAVFHNCGPVDVAMYPPAAASAEVTLPLDERPLEEAAPPPEFFAQCIFVRGYRMRERRPLSPSVIAAAAVGANKPDAPPDEAERPAALRTEELGSAGDGASSDDVSFYSDSTPVRTIPLPSSTPVPAVAHRVAVGSSSSTLWSRCSSTSLRYVCALVLV